MADITGKTQGAVWPLPKFRFSVDWGSVKDISFQEVSGMEAEAQVIEYRHGNSANSSTIKMPGLKKFGNITMKKGIFVKDNTFFDWFTKVNMNTIERQTVIIKLLDEGGAPTMTWTLVNAFPTKVTGTDLKSEGNEVAIESIEIAHEGLTVANK